MPRLLRSTTILAPVGPAIGWARARLSGFTALSRALSGFTTYPLTKMEKIDFGNLLHLIDLITVVLSLGCWKLADTLGKLPRFKVSRRASAVALLGWILLWQ